MVGDFGVGTWGQPAHDPRDRVPRQKPDPEKLTMTEYFSLFGRPSELACWIGSADSEEYLAVVTYLVQRSSAR